MQIGEVTDHRSREGGAIIYPVYSRRSRGLSVGVNLFPDNKLCSFDCPYCEVFPFETDIQFSLAIMKDALRSCILEAKGQNAIRDICFSGNGEPTMSDYFMEAVEEAGIVRDELAREAKLVLITNGTGLLDETIFSFLVKESKRLGIWLKLDAGTESWYKAMDRSSIPFADLVARIKKFAAAGARFTVQTMICTVNGLIPSDEEETAWLKLVTELAAYSGLQAVQIYGKARPAPEDPLARAAPPEILEKRAALLRTAFENNGISIPVEVY